MVNDNLLVLVERHNWLVERIVAKKKVQWDTQWDERERDALRWAIDKLKGDEIVMVDEDDGA